MEDLETQKRLLNLGVKLQNSLENASDDETSAWMASYIAERMEAIEFAQGKEKASMQRSCFEAILLLWEHRANFSDSVRPFQNLEPILRTLKSIDPNNTEYYFFRNKNQDDRHPGEIDQMMSLIKKLDSAARSVIHFFLQEAASKACDRETQDWLNAIDGTARSVEVSILRKLVSDLDEEEDETDQKRNDERKTELIQNIDRLAAFEAVSKETRASLEAELETLQRSENKT